MVYEESYASQPIDPSPKMAERFDSGVTELIRRDRNHPSVVMWGLLNESRNWPAFQHAVQMLPLVRSLDDTRIVMLNSGRYDANSGIGGVSGIHAWKESTDEPWVAINATSHTVTALGITWPAGHLALHPGPKGEFSVVRWTAPAAGAGRRDGHVHRTGREGHDRRTRSPPRPCAVRRSAESGRLRRTKPAFDKTVSVAAGDTIDCVVGWGNGSYGGDTTGLAFTLKAADKIYDATAEFSAESNPHGAWSYGTMKPGAAPDAATFARYAGTEITSQLGSLSNPGSNVWEDVVSDRHVYPRVPHTGDTIQSLRELDAHGQPVFLSEYGIGSAVDLWRGVRHFEQHGATGLEDAQFFRDKLDRFLADWRQWRLDELYARPEDFFMESLKKMAGQRTLGLNAIRSNPNIVGHSLTGAIDHVMCGEGLTTLFRELKPGTIDAMFDALGAAAMVPVCRAGPYSPRQQDPPGSRAGQRGRTGARRVSGAIAGGRTECDPHPGSRDQRRDPSPRPKSASGRLPSCALPPTRLSTGPRASIASWPRSSRERPRPAERRSST